jgi:formylglycine-generating enzyme required for sulfatase activity
VAVDEQKPLIIPDLDLVFLAMPPGTFRRGSRHGYPSEYPPHPARLTYPFWLGQCLVTQRQYAELMHHNPSYFEGAERPVESVSWEDAREFCRRLTERERVAGRIPPGFFFRLPTETEWEYSCRALPPGKGGADEANGPATTAEERLFCYGDDPDILPEYAWFQANSEGRTHAVGKKKPSPLGLHDLHGNVSEWCLDWYAPYPDVEITNPFGPEKGERRIRRGGSWASMARRCRSTDRAGISAQCWCALVGFRVAAAEYGPPPYPLDYLVW